MSFSINTNASSLDAVRVLRETQNQKGIIQKAINSGRAVATSKDNAAVFSIAQNIRSQLVGHDVLISSLERKLGLLDVTLSGTQLIQDILVEMNELAVAAADPGLDQQSRDALQEDFEAHKKLIDTIAANSEIFGHNLIDSRDSNFLIYGADQAKIGATDRTNWEPQPSEEIDIGFTFVGSGKNNEEVDGNVSFYWRSSSDGGTTWDTPQLIETVAIPPHQVLNKDGTPYTVTPSSQFTAPDVPGANAYEIYAEWEGHWPAGDDALAFSDTLAEGKQHKILSWEEYNSQDAQFYAPSPVGVPRPPQIAVDSYNGYDVVPGDGTANQTDAGDNFNVDMKIVNPANGINTFGATVDLYYEWKDEAGDWQRHPVALGSATVPTGPVDPLNTTSVWTTEQGQPFTNDYLKATGSYVELADLSFTGTIPSVVGGIQEARVVAEVQSEHDGDLMPDTSSTRANGLDFQVTNYEEPFQVSYYGSTGPQIIEISNTIPAASKALDFKTSISVDNPDPSILSFGGTASAYLEYFDGASWNRMPEPLDTSTRSGGDSSTALVFDFDMSLRNIPIDAEGIRLVADFALNHDGIPQSVETKTIAIWDGSTVSSQPTHATTLLSWSEPVNNTQEIRTAEFASKIDWLDEARGYNRPLRESNLGTSGLYGLFLADKELSSIVDAQKALTALQFAMRKVASLAGYYGSEHSRTENRLEFETHLSDTLEIGIGNLVDADLAREAAKQQALQVKEQLGLQALNIANGASELILNLFRS